MAGKDEPSPPSAGSQQQRVLPQGIRTASMMCTVALAVGTSMQMSLAPSTVRASPSTAKVSSAPFTVVPSRPRQVRRAQFSPAITCYVRIAGEQVDIGEQAARSASGISANAWLVGAKMVKGPHCSRCRPGPPRRPRRPVWRAPDCSTPRLRPGHRPCRRTALAVGGNCGATSTSRSHGSSSCYRPDRS